MVFTPTKLTSHTFTDEHATSAAGAAQQLDHALDVDAAWKVKSLESFLITIEIF